MTSINIERMLASKNPLLARWLPRFIIGWLKKIVHQDEINEILGLYGELQGLDFIGAALQHLGVTYTLNGKQNLETTRRKLYVSNHPLGGLDGIILLDVLGKSNPAIKTAVNDLLMNLNPLRALFLPVNKHGSQNRDYAQILMAAYNSDAPVLYFPAGLCSRKAGGKIADPDWKIGVMKIVRTYRRDVVPVYFEGANSNFFYRLANMRKMLKIKVNIEMLFLADELFKKKGTHFNIFIGETIHCDTLLQMNSLPAMTAFVRQKVYELPFQKQQSN